MTDQRYKTSVMVVSPVGWENGSIVCPRGTDKIGGQAKRRLPTLLFTAIAKNTVIPAWMLESSHRESEARVLKPCYKNYYL
jgi:hypothetical protein